MKILHLPTTVGGNPVGLAAAERKIGLDSTCLDIGTNNKLAYGGDSGLSLKSLTKLGVPGRALSHLATFLSIRNKYDVFHFNNGHTLLDYYPLKLHYLDAPYYPRNKKIVMTYNGGDARQTYGNNFFDKTQIWDPETSYNHFYNDPQFNQTKRKRIEIIDAFADHILTVNPDLFRFLPKKSLFLPYTISTWDTIEYRAPLLTTALKVVHAPTDRPVKGTKYIIDAVNRLQTEGHKIDLILVENRTNAEALKIYQTADLAIDQLFIGWYGAFSVEVMKMGKPVMAFIRESDLYFLPSDFAKDCKNAFINCNPLTVYDNLKSILEDKTLLMEYSNRALDYVNQWHDPIKVAKYVNESCYLK